MKPDDEDFDLINQLCFKVRVCDKPDVLEFDELDCIETKAWFIKNRLDELKERELREYMKAFVKRLGGRHG